MNNKNMKRLGALSLSAMMLMANVSSLDAFAADLSVSDKANVIFENEIIKGDENGIDPTETFERYRAFVMLNRLLGNEADFTGFSYTDGAPVFNDSEGVSDYVLKLMAYLKANPELGVNGDEFGNLNPYDMITGKEYVKVVLVALGYEYNVDFTWDTALTFATSIGLIESVDGLNSSVTLESIAAMTYDGLTTEMKDGSGSMGEKLGHDVSVDELSVSSVTATSSTIISVVFDGVEEAVEIVLSTPLANGATTVSFEYEDSAFENVALSSAYNYTAAELAAAVLAAATVAVEAYEAVDEDAIVAYSQVASIETLESAARDAVDAVLDADANDAFVTRIDDKKADIDAVLQVFVDAVADATNQLDLFDALDSFFVVNSDYITNYWDLVDGGAVVSTVNDIQVNVVDAVVNAIADQEVVDAIVAAVDASNELQLKTVLQTYTSNFDRLNFASAHIAEYMDEFAVVDEDSSIDDIQDLIDAANYTLADAAVTLAVADVVQTKWNSANALVQALIDDVDPATDKQDLIDSLTEHQLIINVVTAGADTLADAISALDDHTDAADFSAEVYDVLLADYVDAIADATVADDAINTVTGIDTIVQDINDTTLTASLDDIFAVEDGVTDVEDFSAMLDGLVDICDFDMDLVNEDWLADYIVAIEDAALATPGDDLAALEAVFTSVNDDKATDALAALDDEVDSDSVLQALKDLLLTDIVDANADFYLAEVNFQNAAPQSVDFSAADVADIQADVIDTANLVASVINSSTSSSMKTALAPFGVDIDAYVELTSAQKLEVASLILTDIALDADANGDYTNADTLATTLGDVVTEMDTFLTTINGAGMDTIAEMKALLNNDDSRSYVVSAEFEALGVADQLTVAEDVLNAIPENGFSTISNVQSAIATAINNL